jgi:hypothetical protein
MSNSFSDNTEDLKAHLKAGHLRSALDFICTDLCGLIFRGGARNKSSFLKVHMELLEQCIIALGREKLVEMVESDFEYAVRLDESQDQFRLQETEVWLFYGLINTTLCRLVALKMYGLHDIQVRDFDWFDEVISKEAHKLDAFERTSTKNYPNNIRSINLLAMYNYGGNLAHYSK